MNKKTYWMRLPADGTFAQIEGAAERDRLTPLGWEEANDPADTDFVWMRRDDIENPARFAYGSAETWRAMGWEFSAPPDPIDVTKDPQLFHQPKATRAGKATPPPADGGVEPVTASPDAEITTANKSAAAAQKTKE